MRICICFGLGMAKVRVVWMGVIVLCLLAVAVGDSEQCVRDRIHLIEYNARKDRGGLNGMCEAAESMRHDIARDEFPYGFAAQQVKLWHDTGRIDTGDVADTAFYYLRDVLSLASFFIFLGVGIPVVATLFWLLWQRCDEGDQDDDMKNASYQEQVFVWLLGVGLLVCIICLIVFVSLLMVSSSLINSGTDDGTEAAVAAIPQAVTLRNKTVDGINTSLFTELVHLLDSLNESLSSLVPEMLESNISMCISPVAETLNKVAITFNSTVELEYFLTQLWDPEWWTEESGSLSIPSALSQLQMSLKLLIEACGNLSSDTNIPCDQLPKGIPLPDDISDGDVNKSLSALSQLKMIVDDGSHSAVKSVHDFETYWNTTVASVLTHIMDTYSDYVEQLVDEAAREVDDVLLPLRRLHLGLPDSQKHIVDFTSEKNAVGWKNTATGRSFVFCVIILLLLFSICFAVAWGTYNVYYIYLCGNDPLFVRRAHQAGIMLKKLAYCFYVVCFLASVGMSFFMFMAGALGGACGQSRNFTEIMNVIDDANTWDGEYPLAQMVLGNPKYPLIYEEVLIGCRYGNNVYNALHLEQNNFSVFNYHPVTVTINNFTKELSDFSIGAHQLLDRELQHQLVRLSNVTQEIASVMKNYLTQLNSSAGEVANLIPALQSIDNALSSISRNDSAVNNLMLHVQRVYSDLYGPLPLLNASELIRILDEVDVKLINVSNQNITAILYLLESERFNDNLLHCYNEAIKNIMARVTTQLLQFEKSAPHRAECSTPTCQEIAILYDQFSSGVCKDVLDGLDMSWAAFACIFVISIAVIVLNLLLASRFVDYSLSRIAKFSLWDSGLRQMMALGWLLVLVVADIWVINDIRNDEEFPSAFCEGRDSCCASCVWGFGILFVILILLVGLSSRFYQCLLVYRIYVFDQLKVRKYWHIRKKSVQFYTQLFMFIVQDIPFLVIPGTHIVAVTTPMVSLQMCLIVCSIDIFVYVVYIVRERKNVHSYVTWSRRELRRYYTCLLAQKTATTSRYSPGYHHGNSDDDENGYLDTSQSPNHGREVANDEFVYEGYPDHASPVNHTQATVEPHPLEDEAEDGQQVIEAEDYELEETESEVSESDTNQSESPDYVARLDEQNPNGEAVRMRQEAAQLYTQTTSGVDVAAPLVTSSNLRRSATSNSDISYMFSSIASFDLSSSQYVEESSDYRDDDESDYDNRRHKFGQFFTVDV